MWVLSQRVNFIQYEHYTETEFLVTVYDGSLKKICILLKIPGQDVSPNYFKHQLPFLAHLSY